VGHFLQSFLDDALTGYIERTGGFVKDQDSWVLDDTSRYSDSLALTAA
jgi:hypothetical protein